MAWGPIRLDLPEPGTVRWVPLVIAAIAIVLVFRLRWSVFRTLGACAVLGLTAGLVGLPIT